MSAVIRCQVVRSADVELSQESPRKGALTEDLFERNAEIDRLQSKEARCGLWTCGAGLFTSTKSGSSEISVILEGTGTIQDPDGQSHEFTAGDLIVVPDGWSGTWHVAAPVKKWYVSVAT